jgi:hypothetical protein
VNRTQNTGFFPILVVAFSMRIRYATLAAAGPVIIAHTCSLIDDVPMSVIENTRKNGRVDYAGGISLLSEV